MQLDAPMAFRTPRVSEALLPEMPPASAAVVDRVLNNLLAPSADHDWYLLKAFSDAAIASRQQPQHLLPIPPAGLQAVGQPAPTRQGSTSVLAHDRKG